MVRNLPTQSHEEPTSLHDLEAEWAGLKVAQMLVQSPHLADLVRHLHLTIGSPPCPSANLSKKDERQYDIGHGLGAVLAFFPHLVHLSLRSVTMEQVGLAEIALAFNGTCRTLKGIHCVFADLDSAPLAKRAIATFFEQQTQLESLTFMTARRGQALRLLQAFTDPPWWHLRHLTCDAEFHPHLAHRSLATLQYLSINFSLQQDTTPQPWANLSIYTALSSLHLRQRYTGLPSTQQFATHLHLILPFLPPNLTSLHLDHRFVNRRTPYRDIAAHFTPILPLLPPTLVSLDVANTPILLQDLISLLRAGRHPALRELGYARPVGEQAVDDQEENDLRQIAREKGVGLVVGGPGAQSRSD